MDYRCRDDPESRSPAMTMRLSTLAAIALSGIVCIGCNGTAVQAAAKPFETTAVATFDEPWAMAFLPDGRALVTQKKGALKLLAVGGKVGDVRGVPKVAYGGQGGLGDVALHPRSADNQLVYLSYAEEGEGGARGAAVARAKLALDAQGGGVLSDLHVIWRQVPKVSGNGHYGHRLLFGPDGKLW